MFARESQRKSSASSAAARLASANAFKKRNDEGKPQMVFLDRTRTISARLLERARALAGNPSANLFAAVALTLLTLLWRVALMVHTNPLLLLVLPGIAVVVTYIAALYLVLGGAGWLIAQLIRLIIRWRAHEELREGMTKVQTFWVVAGVIFLGVPELTHAIEWWHEHLLSHLPGEEAALDYIETFYKANAETINGLAIFSAIAALLLWKFFSNFRVWLRQSAQLMKSLLWHRDWRFPCALVVASIATGALAVRYNSDPLAVVLALEVIVLFVWMLLPLIIPNLGWIVFTIAWLGPSMLVASRFSFSSNLIYFGIAIAWGAWLFSMFVPRVWHPVWRGVYWLGVLGFLGYLAR
jgi:hypothetical protein